MRVLFVADIVGPEAVAWVAGRLPGLRRDLGLDLVIANAENCTVSAPSPDRGFGMRADLVAGLFAAGVDVITSGNHAWDSPDYSDVLTQPRVLRPHNLPRRPDRPGTGVTTVTVGNEAVTVVNLADVGAIADALPPYPAWREIAGQLGDRSDTVIVDFHGDSAYAKHGFAHAADGEVAAVLGTHTHEPTSTLHLLPGGTALVVDVGMTGRSGGFQGIDPACFLPEFRGNRSSEPPPLALATGPLVLGAVLLNIADGRTTAIRARGIGKAMATQSRSGQVSSRSQELTPDDLIAVAANCRGVLEGAIDADWTVRAGDLEWTCRRTLDHIIDTLLHYAAHFASRAKGRLPFVRDGDPARSVPELLTGLSTSAAILAEVCRAAPPDARGFHPAGRADASGFLAMGCQEVLSHTFDIATGLGIPFSPSDPALVRRVVDRIFPWAPEDYEVSPWDALLWAAGRIALPDRPRLASNWWWHSAPLAEWDGTVKRRTAETPPGWT